MELLLFLSALLSALTGAISGVRAPEAQVHHSAGTLAAPHSAAVLQATPAATAPAHLALIASPLTPMNMPAPAVQLFGVAAAVPLYLARLRR